jgi:8-amino-7-oxononanoate synthase
MSQARKILLGRLDLDLEDLRERGLFREPASIGAVPFCHNDYLGLRRHPDLIEALRQALADGLPTTASGSRLLSGSLDLFNQFEAQFAEATKASCALLFASASEANRVGIGAIVGRHDTVVHDELAHASLIDGVLHSGARRQKFRHNNPEDLRAQLRQTGAGLRLAVTESVFSMDGDVAPLADLLRVCEEEDALLFVDEAHAVGLFGAHATGLSEGLPRDGALIATSHGFGKALSSSGGILCTVPEVLQSIHNRSRAFIYTTAPSPMATFAARWSWRYSSDHPERRAFLWQLVSSMEEGFRQRELLSPRSVPTPILPVHTGSLGRAVSWSKILHSRGYPLRPIRPPTVPAGTERLRLTLSADLAPSQIDDFLEALDVCLSAVA